MFLVTLLSPLIYEQFLLLLLYVDTWMCDESRILDGDTISSVNSYRISSPRENSFLPPTVHCPLTSHAGSTLAALRWLQENGLEIHFFTANPDFFFPFANQIWFFSPCLSVFSESPEWYCIKKQKQINNKKKTQGSDGKITPNPSFPGYKAIYKQIEKFENRYRGRELPGFVNYKTFEIIIKQQIKELEEPAVDMLHTVTGEFLILLLGILFPGEGKACTVPTSTALLLQCFLTSQEPD